MENGCNDLCADHLRDPFDRHHDFHRGKWLFSIIDSVKLYDQHGPAAIGIPVAGLSALLLVCLARALDGPMSLDLFGMKSEGASATCVMWAMHFLVIGLSFSALW
jgi:hypothetical protein